MTRLFKLGFGFSLSLGLFAASMPVLAVSIKDIKHQDNKIQLATENGSVTLKYITPDSIYVHYQLNESTQLPSYLLDESHINRQSTITTNLTQSPKKLSFNSESSSVEIQRSPLRLSFKHNGQIYLEEEIGYFSTSKQQGFRFKLNPTEKLFGGGQRILGMDRRGHKLPLYNKADFGYSAESKQMYYGLPGLMSSDKYILMFDNTAKANLDLGATEKNILQFDTESKVARSAYLVTMSDNFESLIHHYTDATGKQPLPPMWALGNMASRFGYRSEAQAREVVAEYKKQQMPLDAIIFDLYWFGKEMKGNMGNLDWDRNFFPTAEKMIKDFSDVGVNSILISEPFVLTTSNNWQSGDKAKAFANNSEGQSVTYDFYFGNTSLVDVFDDKAQDWFWAFYQKQLDWGAAGVWGDLGEPEVHPEHAIHHISDTNQYVGANDIHNAYGHQWAKMVFNGISQAQPNSRPFIMMRSGFAGSQRYGMIPWTGDVSRTWEGLHAQIELSLQMGLLGLGYIHSDLGGFIETDTFDPELYVRWLQFGAFQPVFRPHAHESVAPEPIYHGEKIAGLVRDALDWRYQLLPYNYSLAFENNTKGTPFMRPTFFIDSQDETRFSDTKAYLWGPSLLVLPVTQPGIKEIEYTLPQGNWFDYWTGKQYQAGQQRIPVDEAHIPVMVKGGAIIPHAPAKMQNTQAYSGDELIVHYWYDPSVSDSQFQLYQDDGKSQAYAQGDYELIDFTAKVDDKQVVLTVSSTKAIKQQKQLKFVIHNSSDIQQVAYAGKTQASLHDNALNTLTFDINFDGKPLVLNLNRK